MAVRNLCYLAAAFVAVLGACASAGPETETAPAQKASDECTVCAVEVENRFDYQVLVFDGRDTRMQYVELKPLGKVDGLQTENIQTKGFPALGIFVLKDEGIPPTSKGLRGCRREPPRPQTNANYRFVCGN